MNLPITTGSYLGPGTGVLGAASKTLWNALSGLIAQYVAEVVSLAVQPSVPIAAAKVNILTQTPPAPPCFYPPTHGTTEG